MPAKNRIKEYGAGNYYHLYNRGLNKQVIFQDEQDYGVFTSYLKEYLAKKDEDRLTSIISNPTSNSREKDRALKLLRLNNFYGTLFLHCYCLMPNHFHFLIHQTEEMEIDRFMNSLCTRYTMYCNKKYKRVGPLLQGVYKGVTIRTNEQLLYVSRYIHRNPVTAKRPDRQNNRLLITYPYSSYPEYMGVRNTEWVYMKEIIQEFSLLGGLTYQEFVEGSEHNETERILLSKFSLD